MSIRISRCVPSTGQTCLEDEQMSAIFKKARIRFFEPKTYVDYDDIENPVKTFLENTVN